MKNNSKIKIEKFGEYIVYTNEETKKRITIFKDYLNNTKLAKMNNNVYQTYVDYKKIQKSEQNEFDRHIEHLQQNDYQLNEKAKSKVIVVEDIVLENEIVRTIIREIWHLPEPQNRRVYMSIIDNYTLTEIAKIEHKSIPAIKRSIDRGLENLRKKLKNF